MQATIPPLRQGQAGEADPLLAAVHNKLGHIPNMLATMAQSPTVLKAYLAFSTALGKSGLGPAVAEQIALATAGANGCDYCASAHAALGKVAGLSGAEMRRNLAAESFDPRTRALLKLARDIIHTRGHVPPETLTDLRSKGFTDQDFVEVMAIVGLNLFTNYFNHIAGTEIDFPVVCTDRSDYVEIHR